MQQPPAPRPGLARYRIPASDIDALARGRVPLGTGRRLSDTERGRRMLMLRAVADTARDGAADLRSPLLPMRHALGVLVRVEQIRPDVVRDMLEHPGTGIWAVRVLDRLAAERGPGPAAAAAPPLWVELGYLHSLAATALLRSGLEGTIRVPVRDGAVALPTLGRVRLAAPVVGTEDDRYGWATLHLPPPGGGPTLLTAADRTVAVPPDLSTRQEPWLPLRVIPLASEGRRVPTRLVLEDSDPYRDFRADARNPPSRYLTDREAGRWRMLVSEAFDILTTRHPHTAALVTAALRVLVPLPEAPRFRIASASHNEAFGSAVIALPPDARDLAVTMVHEARHSILNGLLHQLPLLADTAAAEPRHYAQWRTDPRPLSGLLHGAYAFAGVAEFWRTERHAVRGPQADLAHFEFAVWSRGVLAALDTLCVSPGLTPLGRQFVTCLADESRPWADEAVPARAHAWALDETADLKAVWRARHLRPPRGAVDSWADCWLSGADPKTAPAIRSRLRPDPNAGSPDVRGEFRRILLADPGLLPARVRETDASRRPPAMTAADIHLLHGDPARAAQGYIRVLAAAPGLPSAWAGLGLAAEQLGEPSAARALLRHPEAVRALHGNLAETTRRAPDPLALADWVGRVPEAAGDD